ncbi:hypothetical protein JO41_02190 [Treponema sp. OMZ 838]|uniref:hypothetical protein n=1 Tax=Treponema sp. OMZ 838 TaxID=1539298 RepID=UPI00053012C9|nr:hypothetical protein [Treponema sp. OMZ 838]AIW88754.1 hypothetical protein JO41_02190 [Treponema sp. OMZ 838]
MKKGMKLIAVAAFVCAALSCGQGITSGGKGQTLPKEDEAVFTGSGITFSYDKATGKETKLSDAIRNVRVVFKKDGSCILNCEIYNINKKLWVDMGEGIGTYNISEATASFGLLDMKYSYDGMTLILKQKIVDSMTTGYVMFILSGRARTSFFPLKSPALSIPS